MGKKDSRGYGRLRDFLAHRVAWELANGPIPNGLCVLHHCDTPACCEVTHLFLGKPADNVADCVSKGRHVKGELCWHAKMTDDDVRTIRRLHAEGASQIALARRYGVGQAAIRNIINHKSWKHVV